MKVEDMKKIDVSRYYDTAIGGLVEFTSPTGWCHKCEKGIMIPFDGDGYNWVLVCYDESTGKKFREQGSGCGNIIHVSVNVSVEVDE